MTIQTIPARKAAAAAARMAAVASLVPVLAAEARRLGGRYILFGSAARGTMRGDSDVDLLLDFPDEDATRTAWSFAEERCGALDLPYDIRPVACCGPAFVERVLSYAIVLGGPSE